MGGLLQENRGVGKGRRFRAGCGRSSTGTRARARHRSSCRQRPIPRGRRSWYQDQVSVRNRTGKARPLQASMQSACWHRRTRDCPPCCAEALRPFARWSDDTRSKAGQDQTPSCAGCGCRACRRIPKLARGRQAHWPRSGDSAPIAWPVWQARPSQAGRPALRRPRSFRLTAMSLCRSGLQQTCRSFLRA